MIIYLSLVECNILTLDLDSTIARLEVAIPFDQDLVELTVLDQFFAHV